MFAGSTRARLRDWLRWTGRGGRPARGRAGAGGPWGFCNPSVSHISDRVVHLVAPAKDAVHQACAVVQQ